MSQSNPYTMKYVFAILAFMLSSASAFGVRYTKIKIDRKDFLETITIETQLNLMFAVVDFEGEKYKFLIDTGAPFSISPKLAAKAGFKLKGKDTMRSSNSKRGVQQWGVVKKIKIGNVGFSNITAFVIDFRKSEVLACLDFDGIIGSNLMNTCIWQFDHDAQKVSFTDRIFKLEHVTGAPRKIKKVGKQKAPYVVCQVNKADESYVLFDTGSGDFFDLKYAHYYNAKKAGRADENIKVVTGRGLGASGIYGAIDTTKFMVKLPKLVIAGEEMSDVVSDMTITSKSKVGIRFAKGRVLTFDFPSDQFYIHNLPGSHVEHEFNSFGFNVFPKKEGAIIGAIWENSEAQRLQLPKYAKILKINNLDFNTQNDNCKLTFGSAQILRTVNTVDLTIDDDGVEKKVRLEKKDLFQKPAHHEN